MEAPMAGIRKLAARLATQLRDEHIIARMGERELAGIGFTASDLRGMIRLPADIRDRMEAMAAVHGVSPEQIDAERWRAFDMIQVCGHCPHRRACAAALADPEVTPERCGFCPNAASYRELARAREREAARPA